MRKSIGLGLLVAAAVACAGSTENGAGGASKPGTGGVGSGGLPERVCEPGATQACVGPGRCQGGQVCTPDGMTWGVCDCGGGGAAGSPASGGAPAVGGWPTSGGTATGGFGLIASGGACSTACALGNCCTTPNSYCVNGNITCQCMNGVWAGCNLVGTGGGRGTGGGPSGGTAQGGSYTGGRATGGVTTGGRNTGGNATGGGSTCVGSPVSSLPAMGTACSTPGESQCDASDRQCVCERGIWYCNSSCASTYPTLPTPNTACQSGAACDYPSGASCTCSNSTWTCIGTSSCPAAAPTTGVSCNDVTGVACDYPGSVHLVCMCTIANDGGLPTWTCFVSANCPPAQPPYNPSQTCTGPAICTYGANRCGCLYPSGTTTSSWVCGVGYFLFDFS